jgi:hypothetical protein
LVNWVDQATAREIGQFRELAELHYGRVDARLEQRLSEMDQRLSLMEQRLSLMDQRLTLMDQHFTQRLGQLKAELQADMAAQRAETIKWMILFWVGTTVPLAGLMIALIKP